MAFTVSSVSLTLDEDHTQAKMSKVLHTKKPKLIFVLGGPGSGKGTQCQMIVQHFRFVHISVGDLLRAEVDSGSKTGSLIEGYLKEGKLAPSELAVDLLVDAMNKSSINHFLIDGFPRIFDNLTAFEKKVEIDPEFVLYFASPEDELERRLLNRGRGDDNIETIRKRLQVYNKETLPVIEYYENKGLLKRVNAARSIEAVFETVKIFFSPFIQDELLELCEELLKAIDIGDYSVYEKLCEPELTAFEPESQGHLVEGLAFHKFYFDGDVKERVSTISSPKVNILSENIALVTYTRLVQNKKELPIDAFNETRLWRRKKLGDGWKNVHFHRSKATNSS